MAGCNILGEKDLKKKGRGSYDHRVEENNNIVAVRWFDNKAVTLLSTHTGVQPLMTAKRWNKKKEDHAVLPMPAIIDDYNKHMGGIDLLDSFLAKYRFKMKSRRWYIYLFWHFLMVALVNAWMECVQARIQIARPPSQRNDETTSFSGLCCLSIGESEC